MKRLIASILTITVIASVLAGLTACSKDKDKRKYTGFVEDDGDPWYDMELTYFAPAVVEGGDPSTYEYYPPMLMEDGNYYLFLEGKTSGLMDFQMIAQYSPDGSFMGVKDPGAVQDENDTSTVWLDTGYVSGSTVLMYRYGIGDQMDTAIYGYNIMTGESKLIPYLNDLSDTQALTDFCLYGEGKVCAVISDYSSETVELWSFDGDGNNLKKVNLADIASVEDVGYTEILSSSGSELTLASYGDKNIYIIYDCESGSAETKDMEDRSYDVVNSSVLGDFTYEMREDGIYKNADGKKAEPYILYEDANAIRRLVEISTVTGDDDTGLTMTGVDTVNESGRFVSHPYSLKLKKYDKDPNIGKKLLMAGYMGSVDAYIDEAVYNFNKTSSEYYIMFISDYCMDFSSLDNIDWNKENASEEYEKQYGQIEADSVNNLAMDLIAGEGPDLILNAGRYSQLRSSDCLEDLGPLFERDMDKSDFFANMYEGTKIDGKLYTMPLCFHLNCLSLDESAATKDIKGFTYDEYVKFVKDVCNGVDPITNDTKTDYFDFLFRLEMDNYIKAGKTDFKNDAFYSLAAYCKDNVSDASWDDSDYSDDVIGTADAQQEKAREAFIYNIDTYLEYTRFKDGKYTRVLAGYPSSDGRGPSASYYADIAISKTSKNKDGAWDFVKSLLEKDAQISIGNGNSEIPFRKSACETLFTARLESYNESIKELGKQFPEYQGMEAPASVVSDFINAAESACTVVPCDPSVLIIVNEEIAPYFADQKTIEQVTDTMQNRAQTSLDERD